MKNQIQNLCLLLNLFLFSHTLFGQEKIVVEGAIVIKHSEDPTPEEGTIRYNPTTKDFEGWNGHNWLSLTRFSQPGGGVTDIEGNEYTTVKLGTQEWMVENLKTSKYNDNTVIRYVDVNNEWAGLNSPATGAWCYYANIINNGNTYGLLYNWYAVNSGILCPTGWKVPSDDDWTILIDYLDPNVIDPNINGNQSHIVGGKLKEAGTAHWITPNTGATNESGFKGLPGGVRFTDGSFNNLGTNGYWWSSTESSSGNVWYRGLTYLFGSIFRSNNVKNLGFSVRCMRG